VGVWFEMEKEKNVPMALISKPSDDRARNLKEQTSGESSGKSLLSKS
jgi:hypothetical protein